ncbi:hypothetical protein N7474_004218 [Penicillium riverlandense]|uniref:uncharacterized protein n=1 Tax=Penicillium riverlandense TaxID=1903569 RepID=UPI002546B802|nr:uncharacterized protein N7474_004218 [Penicillium riverlandense]KAJ5818627.1 hypothetical protein N7474_004218 [Penicillium riverlandense]
MDPSPETLDRRARIRENQRKSRARRQEYIQELEHQVAQCKEQAQQSDIDHRITVQKLQAENRQLKDLLASLGYSPAAVEQCLQQAAPAPVLDRKIAIPALPRSTHSASPVSSTAVPSASESSHDDSLKSPENPSLCRCPITGQDVDTLPSDQDQLGSTLCSIAEELIHQYNTRGTDLDEIRRHLSAGFRKGMAGDGCSVRNQILFQVLDEISNGI